MSPIERDARWSLVLARDSQADGRFFYSVQTTGVYCRPSCGARAPRPENVRFHATCRDAEQAGFRACKRCKPDQPPRTEEYAAKVAAACRLIETAEQRPDLKALAKHVDWSPHHFHRIFRAVTGLTPAKYAAAHRAKQMRASLGAGGTVTNALYDAGFNSSGRFYAAADAVLGMTPTAYRKGGEGAEIRFAVGECSLGSILVARSERGVCAILLGDDAATLSQDLRTCFPHATLLHAGAAFEDLVAKIVDFVETPSIGLDLPLDIRGTVFQERVWQALRNVPVGATASYTDIARGMGSPKAVRAVAQACAANTLAVAIPCHRVVRADGHLSGYRWGVERKRNLLKRDSALNLPASRP